MPRYDILTLDDITTREEDEKGLLASAHAINDLISTEIDAGTDASRIVLGGFSQGGAMTLLTGLTTERKLAGLVALSSYLTLRHKLKTVSLKPHRHRGTDGHGGYIDVI